MWAVHVARMVEKINSHRVLMRKLQGDNLKDISIDRQEDNTKWILEKPDFKKGTGFIRFRTRITSALLRINKETFGFHKVREIH